MKITVLGSNGYTGMLLLRILAHHPAVRSVVPASRSQAGLSLREADPGLSAALRDGGVVSPVVLSPEEALRDPGDVVFSALPHNASAQVCAPILGTCVVIDLSADFRFRDARRYERAYGVEQPEQHHQQASVYGLCEWNRREIESAMVIANPGCYPTATLLPLLPVCGHSDGWPSEERALADADMPVVVNAMSGISGAGKKESANLLFAERTENGGAYNPGRLHRHAAEISEQLNRDDVLFTPHLVPMKQGMAVTSVVTVADPDAAIERLQQRYAREPFVELTGGTPPEIRHVRGTNTIRIGWHREGRQLILMSVIDNLWKGASGQAVQNMNIRFGLEETAGLLREGDL